ncbi:MAG TPA: DHA2 family efflux MFS transporter permease subunit [Bryobacteraceae bacterium]|nr:DHA2 family efflux MFS transporter permease subunit [Bryobacteraceae bacterium]
MSASVDSPSSPAPNDGVPAAAWRSPVNPFLIAATVMLATFMEVLDTSIANVALPHIAGNLSATIDESTWVLTSYLISNAIVLPLTGWLHTLFGRKRFYMVCVAIFTLSSLMCGLAPSLFLLILFRILQGVGGGGLQPTSQAILVESFDQRQQGMAMAVYGMGVVVAPIIGPTLGGWITDNFSWRWIFFINVPIGMLSMAMTSALIHDPPYLVRKGFKQGLKIDFIGLGLLCVGLGFLQVVLDKGQSDDWFGSRFILWSTIIGAAGLIGAIVWELRQDQPMINLRLFKNRNFAMATFMMFALGVVLYGTTVLLPVMVQSLMGYTAQLAGMVLSPGAILTLFAMPIVGRLLNKVEPRWLVITGLIILGAGMFRLSLLNLQTGFAAFVLTWAISRGGLPFLFVPINVTAFSHIEREKVSSATGLINLTRNMGGSVGISVVTTLQSRLTQAHQNALAGHLTPLDPSYTSRLSHLEAALRAAGAGPAQAAGQAQGIIYGELVRQSSMLAYIDVFRMLSWLCIGMIPLMFLMKRAKPRG